MNETSAADVERQSDLKLIATLQTGLPTTPLRDLPAVNWQGAGVEPAVIPKPVKLVQDSTKWPSNAPLPRADVVVVTWTTAEWAALNHVFCDYDRAMPVSEVGSKTWRAPWFTYARDYYTILQYMVDVDKTYQGGAPSLYDQAWGQFRMVDIGGLQVLLIKSGMHLAQDGAGLPLIQFTRRICAEAAPKLLLSVGTAGGVRDEDALGSALITNQALFFLLKEFKNAPFNHTTVQSSWQPREEWLPTAQKLTVQLSGFPILPVSPQYPSGATIQPDSPDSILKVVLDRPIITTDSFLFGTTTHKNGLSPDLGCIVEMDDAVLGMVCEETKVPFGFIRNVSDPVINGNLPAKIQEAWAAYIYQELGIYSSFNGALAAWAVIAGEVGRN